MHVEGGDQMVGACRNVEGALEMCGSRATVREKDGKL